MPWPLASVDRCADAASQTHRLLQRSPLGATGRILQGSGQPVDLQRTLRGGDSARCRRPGVEVAIGEMGAGNPAGLS
ncbi:hypothetical protein [Xanthomonas floridensis]|uniref:Uncharacterized protein n=1 Tax=Xanthomonas floridensis TaxID=1843580 RepID=A0A1A9MA31_9XANT|nr:hypothetical protein [Xanthomonas floridensis]MEA5126131.1 hypothetical protein [Xanthomonas floridensis]MEA5134063.1 hypothetical protein [Xanthomonas floridensis]OAG67155.1 hypothetical protein A7D17_19235 [Xanthomonas floridensis]